MEFIAFLLVVCIAFTLIAMIMSNSHPNHPQ